MAFYSEEIIEEVKNSSDIVSIISSYVNLRRRGNTYVGLCPFHKEKTPSFAVQPEKQIYHCFGCGVGGNVLNFVMKIENIGFKEALEVLAEKAGITLPTSDENLLGMSQEELKRNEIAKKEMYEINRIAGRLFYNNIAKSEVAQKYIEQRGINQKNVAKFGLGYALDDNSLLKELQKHGFNENNMVATGLIGRGDSGYLYDKFKNRFMFPIFDVRKRLVAFGGRTLESAEEMKAKRIPKYVNSPENLIYTKGRHLFGLNLAKQTSSKLKKILVVEGYMDVISTHQAGITNVVASLGTALTEQQGRLLRQYADEVVLSYDSDDAGQKAIMRGIEIMQLLDIPVKVLQMDGAKDPDEYVLKYGPEKFKKLIDNAISPVQYKVDAIKKEYDISDTSQKIAFLTKMSEILSKVDNTIERDVYVDKFSQELNVGKEAIIAEIEKKTIRDFNKKDWQSPVAISNKIVLDSHNEEKLKTEKMIIYLLSLADTKIYEKVKLIFKKEDVENSYNKDLLTKIYNLYETGDINNINIMSVCTNDIESGLVSEIMMQYGNSRDDLEKSTNEIIRKLENDKLQNEKQRIIKELQNENTEEERRLLENRLNEIIIKLAKR